LPAVITSNSAMAESLRELGFVNGVGHLKQNLRLKGYVSYHLWTVR